ncbi:MAG: hypothetical protein ACRBCI_05765 [Cellvibrionaceae bacterium]
MYDFFMALPAILAIAVFVIFHLIKNRQKGDSVSLKIIEKLRQDAPERLQNQKGLNSKQLFDLLHKDTILREKVSEQDFLLLKHSLNIDLIKAIIVYITIAALFIVSIVAYIYHTDKPKPLNISNFQLFSTDPIADGLAVDLDSLKLVWIAKGEETELTVFLENIDTKQRSDELAVLSSNGSIEFPRSRYSKILSNRSHNEWNRVRAVFQSQDNTFLSPEFKLHVGITAIAINFGEKVKIGAMIDNAVIQNYNFNAKLIVWKKDGSDTLSLDGGISGGQRDFPIKRSYDYDWSGAKLVYLSPDNIKLIRTEIVFDDEQLTELEAKENNQSNYEGIWYSDYTDVFDNGQSCNQKGTTQLFYNNKYAFSGLISCIGSVNDQTFKAVYHFRTGGIWSIHNNSLIMEIKDVNSNQISASLNGVDTPKLLDKKASDDVTKHMPFSFEILEKYDDRFVAQKHTQSGDYMKVEFIKWDKPYIPSFN